MIHDKQEYLSDDEAAKQIECGKGDAVKEAGERKQVAYLNLSVLSFVDNHQL